MAQINSVYDATATEAMMDDSSLQPSSTEDRCEVHVSLIFQGVTFDPSDLYDALNAQWGTVTTDKYLSNGNEYSFNVST